MIEYIDISFYMLLMSECINCSFPYYAEDDENIGLICQWDKENFYYSEECNKWVLKKDGENDNWIEAKSRKKYWKNK